MTNEWRAVLAALANADASSVYAETVLGVLAGCMKTTILIETLPAVFEMDEILHAMKSRIVGLNCGRWATGASSATRYGHPTDSTF